MPLAAICGLQVMLSLTLVGRNTAFTDEADYLWIGRLVLGNWLHGTSWPVNYGEQILPGSPLIYPPIGALADSIGGLAGARILSLAFMLGATWLLYRTATRLVGRSAGLFAIAIWAMTEPVLRLAFATVEPLSILLMALAAWLVVRASYRRRHGELVAAAAVTLALANATAYPSVIIDPIVIGFAFFVWRPAYGRQAKFSAVWLTGGLVICIAVLMTFTRSWTGFITTVFTRSVPVHQGLGLVLTDTWSLSGLVLVLAAIGAMIAASSADDGRRAGLLGLAGCAALLVPAMQLADRTTSLLDRHLAYGFWFAALAVGYGCGRLVSWLPGKGRRFAAVFGAAALCYPALAAWQGATSSFQGWPNASSFVASFEPLAEQSDGLIYVAGQEHVAEYYIPQVSDWTRWTSSLPLDPDRASSSVSYYAAQLKSLKLGLVALFYSTSFSSASLPPEILASPQGPSFSGQLLDLVGLNSGEPGLRALTLALERSRRYRLVKTGPYNSGHNHAIFAIWQRVATSDRT